MLGYIDDIYEKFSVVPQHLLEVRCASNQADFQ